MMTSMAIYADIIADVSIFGTICRYIGLDNQHSPIVLIIYGIDDTSTTAIVPMSKSQPNTSMALSPGDDDTIGCNDC
jgi:hypothetical protein